MVGITDVVRGALELAAKAAEGSGGVFGEAQAKTLKLQIQSLSAGGGMLAAASTATPREPVRWRRRHRYGELFGVGDQRHRRPSTSGSGFFEETGMIAAALMTEEQMDKLVEIARLDETLWRKLKELELNQFNEDGTPQIPSLSMLVEEFVKRECGEDHNFAVGFLIMRLRRQARQELLAQIP